MIPETLYTERLILSPVILSDLDAVHELHSLPESDRFNTLGIPANKEVTAEIVKRWIVDNEAGNNFTFKIELKEPYFHRFDCLKIKYAKI